nr:hypothetical protein [Deltaproteobacteria bacterium]
MVDRSSRWIALGCLVAGCSPVPGGMFGEVRVDGGQDDTDLTYDVSSPRDVAAPVDRGVVDVPRDSGIAVDLGVPDAGVPDVGVRSG